MTKKNFVVYDIHVYVTGKNKLSQAEKEIKPEKNTE